MTNRTDPDAADDFLRPREAARQLFVSAKTLTRMADRGQVEFIRLPSGHRRYDAASVAALRDQPQEKAA